MKSPNWLSKILKEETVTSTNDRLAELCQEKEISLSSMSPCNDTWFQYFLLK